MNGKEAINNLIEELKWCCNDGVELTDYDKAMIEPIQSDLFILEILKNIIEIVENTTYTANPKYFIKIKQSVKLEEKTLELIKRWLENAI